MKKAILMFATVSIVANSYSQLFEKGSIIMNGSFSFYSSKFKESDVKYSGFEIIPWGGYFVINNLAVGAMLAYEFDRIKGGVSNQKSTQNGFQVGPVVRYYLNNGLFAHTTLGFGQIKNTSEFGTSTSESKIKTLEWKLGIGYAIRLSERVFFEPIVGFKSNKEKYDVGDDTESGFFGMGSFTIKIK
jgi:Autotransporter beta-domain